jgi:Co/Zn/Cd efflux system component
MAWLDPVMRFTGAILVAAWVKGLMRNSSRVRLDADMDHPDVE